MNQESNHRTGEGFAGVNMEELTEDQLIERGLTGDARALDALFARNTRALYQTALRVLGNPEDAEEALQEGLLSAYRNLPRFEEIAIFDLADADRDQRGFNAPSQQALPSRGVIG